MIKRIFSLFLLAVMTTCYTVAPFASSLAYGSTAAVYSTSAGYENLVPKKLEASMKDAIAHIYGKENVDVIYCNIERMIKKAKLKDGPIFMKMT